MILAGALPTPAGTTTPAETAPGSAKTSSSSSSTSSTGAGAGGGRFEQLLSAHTRGGRSRGSGPRHPAAEPFTSPARRGEPAAPRVVGTVAGRPVLAVGAAMLDALTGAARSGAGVAATIAAPVASDAMGGLVIPDGPIAAHAGPIGADAGPIGADAGPIATDTGPTAGHAGPTAGHAGPIGDAGPVAAHADGPIDPPAIRTTRGETATLSATPLSSSPSSPPSSPVGVGRSSPPWTPPDAPSAETSPVTRGTATTRATGHRQADSGRPQIVGRDGTDVLRPHPDGATVGTTSDFGAALAAAATGPVAAASANPATSGAPADPATSGAPADPATSAATPAGASPSTASAVPATTATAIAGLATAAAEPLPTGRDAALARDVDPGATAVDPLSIAVDPLASAAGSTATGIGSGAIVTGVGPMAAMGNDPATALAGEARSVADRAGAVPMVSTAATITEPSDGTVAAARTPAGAVSSDGGARERATSAEGVAAPLAPTAAATPAIRADASVARGDVVSDLAARILTTIERLEQAPPPRVVVVDTGDLRLRVGLDGVVVRLTVLAGGVAETVDAALRETLVALDARGLTVELSGQDPSGRSTADPDGSGRGTSGAHAEGRDPDARPNSGDRHGTGARTDDPTRPGAVTRPRLRAGIDL